MILPWYSCPPATSEISTAIPVFSRGRSAAAARSSSHGSARLLTVKTGVVLSSTKFSPRVMFFAITVPASGERIS